MKRASSVALWRCCVVALALVSVTELAIEAFSAPRVLTTGVLSEPLFKGHFLLERGPTRFVVDSISPLSPLADAGVVSGDLLQWDQPLGNWYNRVAGERDSLIVSHGNAHRRVEVTMRAAPALPRHQAANYIIDMVGRVAALFIGVVIGWRRADSTAFRAFAAAGLLSSIPFPFSAPAAAHIEWLDFIASFARDLAVATLVFFAINYPDDRPSGWRATLKRYYPWFFGLLVAMNFGYYARLYAGFYEPTARLFFRGTSIAVPALFLATIVLSWMRARGEMKVRLQWILATLGTLVAAVLIDALNFVAGAPIPADDLDLVVTVTQLACLMGLVYAILRHRIFDFGLAVNRTLVFAIVGAILLGIFQIAHAIIGEFLHFDDKNKTIVLSAVLAGTAYLSFNQLKKVVEKAVDRIFFSRWAQREEALRRFVKEARHASDPGALGRAAVAAFERFAEGASCALYLRESDQAYALGEGQLGEVAERIDANDSLVLAMIAHGEGIRVRDSTSTVRATLALPMAHRGGLLGFMLVGGKPGGDPYRDDQIDAMKLAAHEVGLDYYALKIEQLEGKLATEVRTSEKLRAQLETAMKMTGRGPGPGAP